MNLSSLKQCLQLFKMRKEIYGKLTIEKRDSLIYFDKNKSYLDIKIYDEKDKRGRGIVYSVLDEETEGIKRLEEECDLPLTVDNASITLDTFKNFEGRKVINLHVKNDLNLYFIQIIKKHFFTFQLPFFYKEKCYGQKNIGQNC